MSSIVLVVQKIVPSGSGNLLKDCARESLGKNSVHNNNEYDKIPFQFLKLFSLVHFLVNI